jgi:hypothetical protein
VQLSQDIHLTGVRLETGVQPSQGIHLTDVHLRQAYNSHIAYISLAYVLDRRVALIRHASDFEN